MRSATAASWQPIYSPWESTHLTPGMGVDDLIARRVWLAAHKKKSRAINPLQRDIHLLTGLCFPGVLLQLLPHLIEERQ